MLGIRSKWWSEVLVQVGTAFVRVKIINPILLPWAQFNNTIMQSINDCPLMQGLTLEKMDEMFSKPWLERTNVCYYLRFGCVLDCVTRKRGRQTEDRQRLTTSQELDSSSSSSSLEGNDNTENCPLQQTGTWKIAMVVSLQLHIPIPTESSCSLQESASVTRQENHHGVQSSAVWGLANFQSHWFLLLCWLFSWLVTIIIGYTSLIYHHLIINLQFYWQTVSGKAFFQMFGIWDVAVIIM